MHGLLSGLGPIMHVSNITKSRQVDSSAILQIWATKKQTRGRMLPCAYIQRHILCEDDLACQPLIALVGRTWVQLCQQETCLHAHGLT
jgi:hypothetical protein